MLQLFELVSGELLYETPSWTDIYAVRDQSQADALASGKDLIEQRYGIRIAANVTIEHADHPGVRTRTPRCSKGDRK
jgi:hypothetical protein